MRDQQIIKQPKSYSKETSTLLESSISHCVISTSTVAIKRSFFNRLNGFNEDLRVCEDYDLYIRVLIDENRSINFIKQPLTVKRAGLCEQLSFSTKNLEIIRLEILFEIYTNLYFKSNVKVIIFNEMKRKLEIVNRGAIKHNNLEALQLIEKIKGII